MRCQDGGDGGHDSDGSDGGGDGGDDGGGGDVSDYGSSEDGGDDTTGESLTGDFLASKNPGFSLSGFIANIFSHPGRSVVNSNDKTVLSFLAPAVVINYVLSLQPLRWIWCPQGGDRKQEGPGVRERDKSTPPLGTDRPQHPLYLSITASPLIVIHTSDTTYELLLRLLLERDRLSAQDLEGCEGDAYEEQVSQAECIEKGRNVGGTPSLRMYSSNAALLSKALTKITKP
ncbi:hypothetical protein MMC11_004750 [Xylographa trunciseda]|nr:hypothetical protein [Xylographa trunciseda]